MNELMVELGIWIGSAATLGLVAGFFLCLARPGRAGSEHARACALEQRVDELLHAQQRKDELLAEFKVELDRAQADHHAAEVRLLQFEASDLEASSALTAQADARFEALAAERAKLVHEVEQLRAHNHSLQERLDESAVRVVELERARQKSSLQASHAAEPAPIDALLLDVEKSMPLTVEQEEPGLVAAAVVHAPLVEEDPKATVAQQERRRASESIAPAVHEDEGAERSVADLPTMPDAVKERLILIGAGTNLAFLHKAGRKVGRRALMASTRLEEGTLLGWLRIADLMRVGLRNEDLRALASAGVQSLSDLARADAQKLAVRLQAKNESRGRGTIDAAAVQRWIDRARSLDSLVEV